jgi:hypothetical protein
MRTEYTITGYIDFPEGSTFRKDVANQVILPDGKIVTVHPILELSSDMDADDHRDIRTVEEQTLGINHLDYDRTLTEIENP